MATAPTPVTVAPTAPDRTDRPNFSVRATAWAVYQKDHLVPEMNALGTNVYNNALSAATDAAAAAASAISAGASATAAAIAGAPIWVSGTTYAIGDPRYSPANQRIYRRLTTGAGTTDPSADPTNWAVVDGDLINVVVNTASATLTAGTHAIVTYAGACTLTLATPAAGNRFRVTVANGRTDVAVDIGAQTLTGRNGSLTGLVTIDHKGSLEMKYIDGTSKLVVL